MATVIISHLPPAPNGTGSGSSQGTDLFPATDTTDTSSAASGTTKKYTLSEIYNWMLHSQGLTTYSAVRVATTGALTVTYANGASGVGATLTNAGAQAALTIDGVALALTNRVLVKDQVSTFQNGIYVVTTVGTGSTNWVLTRATDYDQASEIVQYGVVLVNQGTVNASLLFQETGAGPWTIGTTPIIFSLYQAGSGTSVNAGTANQTAYYATAGSTVSGVGPGSTGQIYQSNGSGSAPAFTTATYPATTTVSQLLYSSSSNVVAGLSTTNRAALGTSATGVPQWLALTDGQLVIGSTAGAPAAANITGGTGVNITNGSNSITIDVDSGGLEWSGIAGTTQSAAVDNGYVVQNAGQTTITLPSTYDLGSTVAIQGLGAGGWILTAAAGDTIQIGSMATSSGGTVTSGNQWDSIVIVAVVANTTWAMQSSVTSGFTVA